MDEHPTLADELLRAAARLNRWASRHAAFDVPVAQARLLSLLDELGPSRVSDLARADNTSQPTTTSQVDRLTAAGWASRTPDPSDARASLVSLTDEGRRVLTNLRAARAAALEPALSRLGARQLAQLRAATTTVQELVSQLTELPTPEAATPEAATAAASRKDS